MKSRKIQDVEEALREQAAESVLLVCGNSFRQQELYGRIKEAVKKTGARMTEFPDFEPNPNMSRWKRESGCFWSSAAILLSQQAEEAPWMWQSASSCSGIWISIRII